jgi:hypothetical protein
MNPDFSDTNRINLTIVGIDPERKISAIKFIRALGRARYDHTCGEPGLRQAKDAVDALTRDGKFIVVENVPRAMESLALLAAHDAGVRLSDMPLPRTFI